MNKYQSFLSENFQFLEVKFSIYLNRHVFVMHVRRCWMNCCAKNGSPTGAGLPKIHTGTTDIDRLDYLIPAP